ncbi:hypothetical protein [Streptomyces sp. Tu 3180]|uniref:hypothetical protein n=1 Tax=Streptomyces sp. Tu 3180 TaxID=2682611 RepID=UPI00135B658D|nr:hypothetical protein [Streptomyces sp. Tu 3180]KAF3466833.1 hypothetical protein GL259_22650 [Streptomyces sp. Tu 3180]
MTEQSLTRPPVPIGFNLVLPPGWGKIDLHEEVVNDSVLALVDRSIDQLPKDLPRDDVSKVRMELFKQLKKAARKASRANGMMLYLPVERVRGSVVPASFIVSEPISATGAGFHSDQVIGGVTAERGQSETVTIDGSPGTRIEHIVPPPERSEIEFPSRRVEYILPLPGSPLPRWLAVTFSTVGDGKPDSEYSSALVDLFDAIMMTFRWSYE